MKPRARIALTLLLLAPLMPLSAQLATESSLTVLDPYTVTGSHLPVSSETSPAPLTVIDSDSLDLWGNASPIEALRKQPFSFGTTNSENDSNSGTGSAGANIHGLGNLSTLTLINGRRAGGNSAVGYQHGGFADLNLIPSAAIREIQVATDGTSVAYGSDAVAGTVNILLHDTFTGNRVDSSYSDTSDGDASEKSISFLTGQNLNESTHLLLLGSWYQRNSIEARDRHISRDTDRRNQSGQNQGSLTYPGRINVGGTEYVLKDGISAPSDLSDYRPWDEKNERYNFSESAVAIPEVERSNIMANISHDITPTLQIWSELLYTDSEFNNGLAPAPWSGSFFEPTILAASKSSPHLPTGIDPDDLNQVNYRSFEIGNLEIDQEKTAMRGLVGLRGQIGEWNWETAGLYIKTDLDAHYSGIADKSAMVGLITSGAFNPFASAYASGPGYDNAAALATAARNPTNHYDEEFWSYDLKANAPIFELPSGTVLLATGLEFRKEEIDVDIDSLFESGSNLGGVEESSFSAERGVASIYAETLIPIFSNNHQKLDLSLSARYEDYQDKPTAGSSHDSNDYDAFVYKAALVYQPHEAIQLRAAYGTSFRAPTLTESYGGDIWVFPIYNDPLGSTLNNPTIPTNVRGNSDLDPEKSTNLNIGVAFEPNKTRGWRVSVDYYRIETEDVIVNGAQHFVDQAALGNDIGDASVIRTSTQALYLVYANWFNAAESTADGIDTKLSYTEPTANGLWQATLGVNQVLTYKLKASDDSPYQSYLGDMVDPRAAGGNIIGRGSIPRYKGYLELIWLRKGLTLGGTLNYTHSLDDNAAFTDDKKSREIDSYTTLDLVASYRWPSTAGVWLSNTTLTVGVDNVSDEAPPFAAGAFADGYDTSLYSLAGRRYRIALSREF
jgi:iron complex outermembrane receptor protein